MRERIIDKIVYNVDGKYGAPMGRADCGERPMDGTRIYDCKVPMSSDGAYDKGGAYWGLGEELRVSYTKDLSFIHFYRNTFSFGWRMSDDGYVLLLNGKNVAKVPLEDEDENPINMDMLWKTIKKFLKKTSILTDTIIIQNDWDNLGVIVDVYNEKGNELIDSQSFWFEDFFDYGA